MNSLEFVSTLYTWIHGILLIILIAVLLWRLFTILKERRISGSSMPKMYQWFKISIIISLIFLSFISAIFLFIASPFAPLIPEWILWCICIVLLLLALSELPLYNTFSPAFGSSRFKRILLITISLSLIMINLLLILRIPAIFRYPDVDSSIKLDLPVKGTWMAGHAGGSTMVNYHCAYASQMYAMDIVKVNESHDFFINKGDMISDFFTMGAPVYAPADGEVVISTDGLPNEAISFSPDNRENPAGNHVVIKIADSAYVYLAHLDSGTVALKKGDLVSAGDYVGNAGNSGNTSWPHLHMHVQNIPEMDFSNARALPYRFNRIERNRIVLWHKAEDAFLLRNDLFRSSDQ